nr:hypothetical protein [Actinomadura hibisca]
MLGEEVDLVGDDPVDQRRVVDGEVVGVVVPQDAARRGGRDFHRDLRVDEVLPVALAHQQRAADPGRAGRGVVEQHLQPGGGRHAVVEPVARRADRLPALQRARLVDERELAGTADERHVAARPSERGAQHVGDDRRGEADQVAEPGAGRDGAAVEDRALHDRRRQLRMTGGRGDHVAGAERRPPQRDPAGVEFRPRPGEGEGRVDVAGVAARADELPGLPAGLPEVPEVEGEDRQPGGREPLLVLVEHHLVRRAAAVHQHDGGVGAGPVGERQPGGDAVAAGGEGGARGHGTPLSSTMYVFRES